MMATLWPSPREKRHASSNSGDGFPLVPVPGVNTVVVHAADCIPAVALGAESRGRAAGSASGRVTAYAAGAVIGDSASSIAATAPTDMKRIIG
jgi:hypothetical protein